MELILPSEGGVESVLWLVRAGEFLPSEGRGGDIAPPSEGGAGAVLYVLCKVEF